MVQAFVYVLRFAPLYAMADDRRRKPCLVGVDQRIKGYGGCVGTLAGGASIAGGAGAGPLAKCESDVGCSVGSQ